MKVSACGLGDYHKVEAARAEDCPSFLLFREGEDLCVSTASWCVWGLESGSKYTVETFVLAELEGFQQLPPDQWNTITSFVGKEK